MDNDILDSLEDLGYTGPLLDETAFQEALDAGPKSIEFTKLVEWLTRDLSGFTGIDEYVNSVRGPEDAENFMLELSGFLREFGCPYTKLSDGPISQRLDQREDKLHLLDYLCTELEALRMTAAHKPHLLPAKQQSQQQQPGTGTAESETARYLKLMLIALGFPKPPEGITPFQLFSKVEAKVRELITKAPPGHLSKPLLKARLSEKQWQKVDQINQALLSEYECRREMVLKRLDVTVQSFKWSDRAKQQDDKLATVYQPRRRAMVATPEIGTPHVLAAREDLTNIEKTSSGAARERTKCAINKVKIGHVPDRGGRAYELEPPPPEMPSFMKRQDAPRGQRQGGRGGRGGRGGGDYRGGQGGGGGRGGGDHRGGQGGGGGGGGGWGGGSQHFGMDYNAGNAFYGGGGGPGAGYQPQYQQYQQQGGYQQGGYQQGGYQQGGYQQGGYQQGYSDQGQGGRRGGRGGRGGGRGRGRR